MPQPFLTKQTYRLNMGQGLDTHTDAKVLSSGKMIVLQNAKFTTGNRLSKRDGFAAVGSTDSTEKIQRLSSYNNQVIGFGTNANGRGFFTYDGANALGFNSVGAGSQSSFGLLPFNDFIVSTAPIFTNQDSIPQVDSASVISQDARGVVGGHTLYFYFDAGGSVNPGVYAALVSESDGSVVPFGNLPLSSPQRVRCTSLTSGTGAGSTLVGVVSTTATGFYLFNVTPSNVANASTTFITKTTLTTATPDFDILANGMAGSVVIAYQSNLTTLQLVKLSALGVSQATASFTSATSIASYGLLNAMSATASTTYALVFVDGNSKLNFVPFNTSLTFGTPTLSVTNPTTVGVITGQNLSDGSFVVYASSNTSSVIPKTLGTITPYKINSSGTFTQGTAILGMGLQSKPLYIDDNNVYSWTIFPSMAQGQYLLYNDHKVPNGQNARFFVPCARALSGSAMSFTQGGLPVIPVNVNSYATNKYRCAATYIAQQRSSSNTIVQSPGVALVDMDYGFTSAYRTQALNGQTVIGGGFNSLYDGNSLSELGFLIYPEGYTAAVTTTSGLLGSGTYQYVCTYEWIDYAGNLHRSETGVPLSVTTSTTTAAVTLTIPNLRATAKQLIGLANLGTVESPVIGLYRTTVNAGPSIFYRVGTVSTTTLTQSVTITDILADSAITANQLLYTQGGITDNFTIDGTSVICAGPDRLYAADPNNTGIIHVGKPYNQTDGLSFFAGINIPIPSEGGPVTNMQYMDSSLVIFKARMIIVVQGQGPTANGQNNGYSPAQVVSRDVGCDNPHAATLYPDGILFKSAKGYYRLGRDLSFAPASNYIGAGVEAFNASLCLRAMLREDRNEARFLLSDNATILVYNYLFNQWSTIITSATDMTEVNGSFYVSSNTPSVGALVAQETVGTFTDALLSPTGIPFLITTGWCALNQLQGCQRVYRVRFLGDSKSTHTLQVEFAYDFEGGDSPTFSETHTITSANITVGGSAWQCEAFPIRQKCEAIAIRISDPSPTGESFDITDVELEVGVIPGRRFPLNQNKGF